MPSGLLRRVLTEMLSKLIVSPENTETSAMLRISLTDCLVAMEMLSHWVMDENSDMMDMSELGRAGSNKDDFSI